MMNSTAGKGDIQWNIQSAIDFKLLKGEKVFSAYILLFSIFDFVSVCICCMFLFITSL